MQILFPPRPKGKTVFKELPFYEKNGWIVQRKFKGNRCLIHVKDGKVQVFSRHGKAFTAVKYVLSSAVKQSILGLKFEAGKEYWLDSELMHPRIPDTIILFDILQAGSYLLGESQIDRLNRLAALCGNPTKKNEIALEITPNLWLAEYWDKDFQTLYKEAIPHDYLEGLVLRKRNSVLDKKMCSTYDTDWQIRCRKPEIGYTF